jgi:hypothetical protein
MTTGSWTVGVNSSEFPFYGFKSWTGTNGKTEPWQGGIRTKWNNYELQHVKWRQTPPTVFGRSPANLPAWTLAQIASAVGWSNNDDLRLLEKLSEVIRGHSFDLGVNIAEASKSYGTVVKNLRSIGSALHSLKHGRIGDVTRQLGRGSRDIKRLDAKDLSGRWLETQYAFMPLIDQSYEAAKALEAVTGPRRLQFSAKSPTKRITFEASSSLANYLHEASATYSKCITCELREDLSLQRSLGLVNPAEIAWELVPYSFVVDWFIPVGTYIGAWGVIPALDGRFCTTLRGSEKSGPISHGTNPANNNWTIYAACNKRELRFRTQRTVGGSLSIPHPSFNKLPKALSPKRILNAVALIHQRLG